MEEKSPNNSSSQFLKTDGGKTKSNAIDVPSISLPKGGGAIKGIDEKFSVNAVNGTASFSIPLPVAAARGAVPALSLSYNSGSGNGIFGLGWNLSLPSIKRKTDKGLPQYYDSTDSDIFLFSEAEDLVPEFRKETNGSFSIDARSGDYTINERTSADGQYRIRFYRPRIEGLFARVERWMEITSGTIKWRVITRDNITTLFGWSSGSRIADPSNEKHIYEWLPEFVFDDKGNCSKYGYVKDDVIGFRYDSLHNRNRIKNDELTYTNTYLQKVLYGNKTPYVRFEDAYPVDTDFLFETLFDYGTPDTGDLTHPADEPDTLHPWDFRPDAFSDYKAGFEIRTTRLCKRVLLFHVFGELALNTDKSDKKTLVKSVNFDYNTTTQQDFTFLQSVKVFGYIKFKQADGTISYSQKNLPPVEFTYQQHDWNAKVKTIAATDVVHAPSGLDEPQYQFMDLFNEGLAGILTEQAGGWYYKHNLGNGHFERAKLVSPKPNFMGLGSQLQLADLDANGGKQLVNYASEPKGYFELSDEEEWQPFRNFRTLPNINLNDANTRLIDLNGDGKSEILISEDNVFTWYESAGKNGFDTIHRTAKPYEEETGPNIVFADSTQSIFLADMSGDGLSDIVRIRNGEVCYWPNLGYGKFGKKLGMDHAPLFDFPDSFHPSFVRLADIDGSGTTDIIYLGKSKFSCWSNLSGNAFSTIPFEIDAFPDIHNQAKITVTDLLGNGVACIVWSSPLPKDANAPLRFVDLMNSKKPHIMVKYVNNMGKEVSLEYAPSTKFYLQDKLAGKPWVTKLHFPVHCISKTIIEDKISGYKFISEYKYHHGYYDHAEREFRGFGMVEQTDAETFEHWEKGSASNIVAEPLHQEPVVSKTWHHTGAFLQKDKILNQFAEDYWYEEMQRQGFSVTHHEVALRDARLVTAPGIDPSVLDHFSAQEWQEAVRACKGMGLRSETFAKDAVKYGNTEEARKKELTPFSVATHNCVIELLQPKGKNKHAVFVVKESEAITYSYERNTEDPRIAHSLNIKLDEYGNVLESAAVVYPRVTADVSIPTETQQAQSKTVIIYAQNQFTNDVWGDEVYRLRLPSEVKTYELKGVSKTNTYFSPDDFTDILSDVHSDTAFYHELNQPLVAGRAQKRLIEHVRSTYYRNHLTGALPLHHLESLALPFESYQLAYTPELITDIYGTKLTDDLLTEGKFTHSEGDNNWWIRSGTVQFIDAEASETLLNAQNRFYVPVSYTDPYGAKTRVKYYSNYFLFVEETEDALGNKSKVDVFNFRTFSPQRLRDINNNLSEAIADELGLVKAIAVLGKGNEADDVSGLTEYTTDLEQAIIDTFFTRLLSTDLTDHGRDLLQHATARFVYDFDVYKNTGKPAVVASIMRETHYRRQDGSLNPNSKLQLSFEYSNGLGKVIMKKVQAEPGLAKKVTVNADNTYTVTDEDTSTLNPVQLRWIGNGRTILNNKGNPVKQYEPYFSVTHRYEDVKELVETGVTPIMYYDAAGRLVKTEMPDGTFSKVAFDSWKQSVYDANDTVLESIWYLKRTDSTRTDFINDVKEHQAAAKAIKHANTPNVQHFDTLGRPVLSVEHNKNITTEEDEFYHTKVYVDTEGNLRNVTDARNNIVMQYKYDMLGNKVYQNSMDAGQRWLLINILGNPLRTWDERDHEFRYFYDALHRPLHSVVINTTGKPGDEILNNIFDRIIYGESLLEPGRTNEAVLQATNILGKPIKNFDTAGVVETPAYDFKGQPINTTRRIFKEYKNVCNWHDTNINPVTLPGLLEDDIFTFITETDALGRITMQIAPDGSMIVPSYNEAGLLNGERVTHIDPAITTTYIKDIDYNEKGQRNKIIYGNDVSTKFYYDKETFRLKHLESKKQSNEILQDLYYTYDPVGNITFIKDDAYDPKFFSNRIIEPISSYTYDALYRLIEATGKENNAALSFGICDNWDDRPFMHEMNPGDPIAVRSYTQHYQYDSVGNIMEMRHVALHGNWTRTYEYETNNNRLQSTRVGNIDNPANYTKYTHHLQHGFLTELPHLEKIGWNFKEELVLTTRQHCTDDNIPITTYYQYDGEGQRIRKITENFAAAGAIPTKKEERIYISGYETYKTYEANTINFERESLSLIDESNRFVMIETVKFNPALTPEPSEWVGARLVRYQLHNHLGSAALELNDTAQVISYEEYHPYGTTAYQAKNASIKAVAKRYRYTGMERDEETGLEYHSARYYLPWLGRWLSSDPIGIGDGVNVFNFNNNSPLVFKDDSGKEGLLFTVGRRTASDGSEVSEADMLESGIRMAQQMRNELWEIFAIQTEVRQTDEGIRLSYTGTGQASGCDDAQHASIAQSIRDTVRSRLRGSSEEDVESAVADSLSLWEAGRQRLLSEIVEGREVVLTTYTQTRDLMGMANDGFTMYANPFTWYLRQEESDGSSERWISAFQESSDRARRTFGPAMLFLHELDHGWGWFGDPYLFPGRRPIGASTAVDETPSETVARQRIEERTTDDIDLTVRDHPLVGQRLAYYETWGGADQRFTVYIDEDRPSEVGGRHRGSQWAIFPSAREIRTGIRH